MKHTAKNVVIVLALASAGLFAAWLRLRSQLAGEGELSDGAQRYAAAEGTPVRYAVWDEPQALGPEVNSTADESRPALSPDGRWLVFAVGERGLNVDLYVAEIAGERVLEPRPIASVASTADDLAPAFAEDALWFASDRTGGAGGLDLYRAPYSDGTFGTPVRLGAPLNTPADDADPTPGAGESTLVFASNRAGSDFDLFLASEPLASAPGVARIEALDALNSTRDEREPAFSGGGRTLYFASDREGGAGGFDLYQSRLHEESWTAPRPLARLATAGDERGPAPTADGFVLYFERAPVAAKRAAADAERALVDAGRAQIDAERTQVDAERATGDLVRARSLELYRLPGLAVGWADYAVIAALLLLALLAWLAQRWPAIDVLYKCFLVSLIVHLLLLWWFRSVYMEHGADGGTRPERHRVRLLRENLARDRERGGAFELARERAEASAGVLARAELDAADLVGDRTRPAEAALGLASPSAELDAPARATREFAPAPAETRPELALATPSEVVERQSGAKPELAFAPAATSSGRAALAPASPAGPAGPERAVASIERSDAQPAALSAALEAAPAREGEATPARAALGAGELARATSATSATAPVELAQPTEAHDARGGGARELALEPSVVATGRDVALDQPERVAVDTRGTNPDRDAGGPPSAGPATAQLPAPSAPSVSASPARSSATDVAPAGIATERPAVVLADDEPRPEPIGAREAAAHGASGSSDWIAALLPAESARTRASDPALAPERWQPEATRAEPLEPTPSVPLAASAPPDRDRPLPPVERKTWDDTPYQNRAGEEKARAIELHGGTAETELAVAKGLAYLARIQRPRGHWGRADARDGKYGEIAIGKTGLVLLAFLGAGHTQASGTEYSDHAARAVAFLIGEQDEASGHFGDSEAYGHGIATYALAECYALTSDPRLRAPIERAVAHILAHQSTRADPRHAGGWGYYYADDERTFDPWPRTSITVWQVMALESARLSGLEVPDVAFDAARAFLLGACDAEQGYVRYSHDPERLGSGYPTLPASTPAGLFALSLLGEDIASDPFDSLRAFVGERAPAGYRYTSDDAFVARATGNLYFWYYGTLAMFRTGGGAWQRWNEAMKETLLPAQQSNGSWKPIDIYARYAKDDSDDRSYTTALCVLSLEVYYRYFLPLLQVR